MPVKKLKNNKASAYCQIMSNEMIKAAFPVMKEIVVKVFNKLLKAGQFSACWTEGIVVPIHKINSCVAPKNTGLCITINSCSASFFVMR